MSVGRLAVVCRGEHGEADGRAIQCRRGSMSFVDNCRTARICANTPNDRGLDPIRWSRASSRRALSSRTRSSTSPTTPSSSWRPWSAGSAGRRRCASRCDSPGTSQGPTAGTRTSQVDSVPSRTSSRTILSVWASSTFSRSGCSIRSTKSRDRGRPVSTEPSTPEAGRPRVASNARSSRKSRSGSSRYASAGHWERAAARARLASSVACARSADSVR